MDFLVTDQNNSLVTESINDDNYPGLDHYDMTEIQKQAVMKAMEDTNNKQHLSPIASEYEDEEDDDEEDYDDGDDDIDDTQQPESNNTTSVNYQGVDNNSSHSTVPLSNNNTQSSTQSAAPSYSAVPSYSVNTNSNTNNMPLATNVISTIQTMATPDIHSKISDNHILEDMKKELATLRKKVAMTANMQSLISKLDGAKDTNVKMDFIQSYARRKFKIQISKEDFECMTDDEINCLYNKSMDSERSDRYDLIYKTIFDFGVSSLETILNKYVFKVDHLSDFLLYEDISHELTDIKKTVERSAFGSYADSTSPIFRIITYGIIQVTRAKFQI